MKMIFPELPKSNSKKFAILLLVLATSRQSIAADLQLNQLDACDNLSRALEWLRSTDLPSGSACRSSIGPIERQISKALQAAEPVCFLKNVPVPSLTDFRCLRFDARGAASLTCYRTSSISAVADYKQNFNSKYATTVARYLSRAGKCSASNGDTTSASETLFPAILAFAGAHQVAFISQLGNTHPAGAAVIHGFASTSPAVTRDGVEAFEYVSLYRSSVNSAAQLRIGELHGKWRLLIDEGGELESEMKKAFRKAGVSVQLRLVDVSIRRDINASSYQKSKSLTEEVSKKLISGFVDEGFEEMSNEDIGEKTGIKDGDLMSAIKGRIPHGSRSSFVAMGSNPSISIMMKTSGAECTRHDQGGYGVGVSRHDGPVGVRDDFGNVGVFVFGVGACGRDTAAQRRYLSGLVSDAKETILAGMPHN